MDEKYIIEKLKENEDRSRSNARRLDNLEEESKSNNLLAMNVRELTVEIKYMREDYQKLAETHAKEVKEIDTRVSKIEQKPANNWENIKLG